MTPNSPSGVWFEVTDENGDPVTGLDLTDFTVHAVWWNGSALSAWAAGATIVEHPSRPGHYLFPFTSAPATPAWRLDVIPTDPDHSISPAYWSGDQNILDIDKAYTLLARSVVADPISILIGSELPRTKGAYFYDEWNIPITLGGLPLDLSDYTDLTLRVNTLDKTTRSLEVRNGESGFVLTASAEGILHLEWPSTTGTGVADIYAHLPAGATSATPLKWQVDGLLNGDPTKRVPIIRSSDLTLFRSEEVVQ